MHAYVLCYNETVYMHCLHHRLSLSCKIFRSDRLSCRTILYVIRSFDGIVLSSLFLFLGFCCTDNGIKSLSAQHYQLCNESVDLDPREVSWIHHCQCRCTLNESPITALKTAPYERVFGSPWHHECRSDEIRKV